MSWLRLLLRGCTALLVPTWLGVAGDVSFVVLHRPNYEGLVRLSADGMTRTTIAKAVGGYGLAVNGRGDYIVADLALLHRVTPAGLVSNIATAPSGSQWLSVALDSAGNYILADNRQHAIWRVSEDGRAVHKVAHYPVRNQEEWEEVAVIVNGAGDYLLVEGNSGAAHFWLISPGGAVTPIPLRGKRLTSAAYLVADGAGAYLVVSYSDHAIFRVTPTGDVTGHANLGNGRISGLARNPQTGELVTSIGLDPSVLLKIGATGSPISELAGAGYVTAIIAESSGQSSRAQ